MTVCTFAGHREVYSSLVAEKLESALTKIVLADGESLFYSGGMGQFDHMCEAAVRSLKRKYLDKRIRLVLVLPYMTHRINRDRPLLEANYDDILVPQELMGLHYKAAIQKRNRWVVEHSDVIVAYTIREFGGAYDTVKYASRLGKPVWNLAECGGVWGDTPKSQGDE